MNCPYGIEILEKKYRNMEMEYLKTQNGQRLGVNVRGAIEVVRFSVRGDFKM